MGLNLTISIITHDTLDLWLCYDRIQFEWDYDFFSLIAETGGHKILPILTPTPVPATKRVEWYNDDGIETIKTDAYGSALTYLPASEFNKINTSKQWNTAILEMLKLLPEDTPIVLYWS